MPTITFTITIETPEGVTFKISGDETGMPTEAETLPKVVLDAIERLVPTRYRPFAFDYVNRCVSELGCSVEVGGGQRRDEYLSLFPPPRCRRARVAGMTYSSTRTAIYCGTPDLQGFSEAQPTLNSGVYAYPKLPHLESENAVNEAIELTKKAIDRLER